MRVALAVLLLLLGIVTVARALADDSDFDGFHRAGRHLLQTGDLSTAKSVARYPPTFQLFHAPWGVLPLGVASALFYALSLLALFRLPRVVQRLSGVPPREQRLASLLLAPLVVDNLFLGQSAPLLLWVTLGGLACVRGSQPVRGGLLLGLATCFKVLPALLMLPALLLAPARGGSWRGSAARASGGFALGCLVSSALLVAAVGWPAAADACADWVAVVRAQTPEQLVAADRSLRYNNQALGVTLATVFGDLGALSPRGRPSLAALPLPLVWTAHRALTAGLLLLVLAAAWRQRGARDGEAWLRLSALAALASLFLSPIVWTHYFVWVLPALIALRRHRRLLAWSGAVLALALAVVPLRGLGIHLWASAGALVLLVGHAFAAPREDAARAAAAGSPCAAPPPAPSALGAERAG